MRIFATRMFCRIWLLSQANVLKHVDTSCIKFTISQHARWMTKWFGQGFDTGLCGCCYSQRFVDAVALDIFSMFIHVFSGFRRSQLPNLPGGTSPCSWCSLVQSPVSRQTVNPGIGQIFGVFILEDLSLARKKNHKVQWSRDGREREQKHTCLLVINAFAQAKDASAAGSADGSSQHGSTKADELHLICELGFSLKSWKQSHVDTNYIGLTVWHWHLCLVLIQLEHARAQSFTLQ